jgi:hypothetical protein
MDSQDLIFRHVIMWIILAICLVGSLEIPF